MRQPHDRAEQGEAVPIRERWTARPADGSDEALAGSLLRSAATVRPFGGREMAEVSARLRSKERLHPRPWALQVLIALVLILCGGAISAGVLQVLRRSQAPAVKPQPPTPAPQGSRTRARHPRWVDGGPPTIREPESPATLPIVSPVAPATSPAPTQAPLPLSPARSTSQQHPTRTLAMRQEKLPEPTNATIPPRLPEPAATPPPPLPEPAVTPPPRLPEPAAAPLPPPAASALARESRLLARAIAELRQRGSAELAVATLEERRREFGSQSPLASEAKAVEVEALLRLGRHAQALVVLDGMALGGGGPQRELLAARAELRAEKGRHTAALSDFDRLLARGAGRDAVTERARFGRATSRARSGDTEGARHDVAAYLSDFPDGRFAGQARAMLSGHNP